MCDSRSHVLRCSPTGFDFGSDRGERDGWFDESTVHFIINIKSFVGCGACGYVVECEHFPAFRAGSVKWTPFCARSEIRADSRLSCPNTGKLNPPRELSACETIQIIQGISANRTSDSRRSDRQPQVMVLP